MPGSQTKLDVYNMAIDVIKDTALQSTEDPTATARWLNRNFKQYVVASLRNYPWNFAQSYVKLAADALQPAFRWRFAYKPPPGWVRILPITRYGDRYGDLVPYSVVGNRIYTNEPAPLCVILILDKSANPGEWDALFTQMIFSSLALGMANKFTGKAKYVDLASQLLSQAVDQAETMDAFEGAPEPIETFDVLRVRGLAPGRSNWR